MPRFPKSQAQIVAFAERLWRGLLDNHTIFIRPPFHPMHLRFRKLIYQARHGDFLSASAAAETATTTKDEKLDDLIAAMKADLRYAENTTDYDDDKLKLIGWAGKKAKTPLALPGQPRLLEAPRQGKGWVFLDWKAPTDGGKPKAYKVQRRVAGAEPVSDRWDDIATAILTEATLVEQPERTELEYRVIAVNKAGEGSPSNVVMAVL